MNTLALNLVLALVWTGLSGDPSLRTFVKGYVVGMAALWLSSRGIDRANYFRVLWRTLRLVATFGRELIVASVRVSHDVLRPNYQMEPAVLAIPVDLERHGAITLLVMMVTLTPGSMVIEITDERIMYIHAMYAGRPERVRRDIKSGFEHRIRELLE